jgi:hypothetical protein
MSEPMFQTDKQAVNPLASVTSEGQPQQGQKHRSSGNFSTQTSNPPQKVQWWITDNSQSSSITFDVMEDKSLAPDPTIYAGLKNGSVTSYYSSRSLYIANPKNTGGNSFGVQAWPYPS